MCFAVINHQFVDIHQIKKHAENMLNLCSSLSLITLFHFLSQCVSAPYLQSGMCKGFQMFYLNKYAVNDF